MNGRRWWTLVAGAFNACFFTVMLLAKIDDQPSTAKTFLIVAYLVGVMVGVVQVMLGTLGGQKRIA